MWTVIHGMSKPAVDVKVHALIQLGQDDDAVGMQHMQAMKATNELQQALSFKHYAPSSFASTAA